MPNEFGVCMVYGRCCTGCDGARQAWVSRHFCPVGIFWSPEFLCSFFSLYWFLPFRKRWGQEGGTFFEFRHSIPAFPMAILEIYGMLSLTTAGLFMFLYYINNGRLWFLKKEVKIFFINLYKCMIEGMELSDWQDNPERWSDRRYRNAEILVLRIIENWDSRIQVGSEPCIVYFS